MSIEVKRHRQLNKAQHKKGPVVYWMSRDQRADDNHALLYAQQEAIRENQPLAVVFCLTDFPGAGPAHYEFMLRGLMQAADNLHNHNISFHLVTSLNKLARFIAEHDCGLLVTDFSPLRIKTQWQQELIQQIHIPLVEVDAHNIVPCWLASPKQEYAARTLRPKINQKLALYLQPIPSMQKHKHGGLDQEEVDWQKHIRERTSGKTNSLAWLRPGIQAAHETLHDFIRTRLPRYAAQKNDPTKDAVSDLSPYLHFGHISSQRVALEVAQSRVADENKDAFLEELIIRKELADNFCYYQPHYDSMQAFPEWAKKTLGEHSKDKREYLYTKEQFEKARTHDKLWNAAQKEMVSKGKMHSYMRMYWAKKILEWTPSAEEAMSIATALNDKHSLDGRDPNGYTGISWSIGGVHDRPWKERAIFGTIRYMSYAGCSRKFDIEKYIAQNT